MGHGVASLDLRVWGFCRDYTMRRGPIQRAKLQLKRNTPRHAKKTIAAVIEVLESRKLLSAGLPDLASGNALPVGFTYATPPAEYQAGSGFYWPAGMNFFAPPISSTASAATGTAALAISAAGLTAEPGQALTVTGSNFNVTGTNVNVLIYGQTFASNGVLAPALIRIQWEMPAHSGRLAA